MLYKGFYIQNILLVSDFEFSRAMRPWKDILSLQNTPVLIGVSGGSDSMALAFLASRLFPVFAVIIDHGLRQESFEEAKITAERLALLNIPSEIIRLNPACYPKGGGIQERARQARFEAFHHIAEKRQAKSICLAHHQGDQDETIYMRWQKESGKFGLRGILPLVEMRDIFILRPLLPFSKERLKATLQAHKIHWCEDPSNQNRLYERVRIRQDISQAECLKMRSLAGIAQCSAVFENFILYEVWKKYFIFHQTGGWAEFSAAFWEDIPSKTGVVLLRCLIQCLSASAHPPAFESVLNLYKKRCGTLGGVRLCHSSGGKKTSFMVREMRSLPAQSLKSLRSLEAGKSSLWGGVWHLAEGICDDPGIEIRPLGTLRRKLREKECLPFEVAQSLPSLWKGEKFLGTVAVEGIKSSFLKIPFQWQGSDLLSLIGIRKS